MRLRHYPLRKSPLNFRLVLWVIALLLGNAAILPVALGRDESSKTLTKDLIQDYFEIYRKAVNKPSLELHNKLMATRSSLTKPQHENGLLMELEKVKADKEKGLLVDILADIISPNVGKRTVKHFASILGSTKIPEDERLIIIMLRGLGISNDPQYVRLISSFLNDGRKSIIYGSIRALGLQKTNEAFIELENQSINSEKLVIRSMSIDALFGWKGSEVRLLFVKKLNDDQPDVRSSAIRGMSQFEDNESVQLLGQMLLDDDHPMVRMNIISAFEKIDNPLTMKFAEKALSDPFPLVKKQAEKFLSKRR